MLYRLLLCSLLAIIWCFLQNSFTPQNLVVGFVLGIVVVLVLGRRVGSKMSPARVFSIRRLFHMLNFTAHLLKEIFLANLRVVRLVLMPRLRIKPGIIALPTDVRGDLWLTTLANSITLTPGTLTLYVNENQNVLYIHTLDIKHPEQTEAEIKNNLEKYILRLDK